MSRFFIPLYLMASALAVSAQEKTTWQDHIRPIFENRCNNCHNADKKKGDLDLSTFAGVIAGGSGGASVEAGDSAGSTLWKVVSHSEEPSMPPKGDKIPQSEIDLIAKWIAGGLLDTPDGTAKEKRKASFAMAATASTTRPEGPPPLPEHLLLEPVVTPARPNVAGSLAHSPWAPLTALAAPRQVLLYHSGTGELLGVLPFPDGGTPETVSFSRNGALLLAAGGTAGKRGTVVVWEVKTGLAVINLTVNEDSDTILAADISADLGKVAVGGPGRRVRIYDTRSSQLLANIKKHTDWVTALAFSPDGVLLASGDRNGGLYVWEAGTGNEFYNLRAHEKRIASLAWRADSNLLAAGSEDGNMTWWEMANGSQVKKIASHGGVLGLGFAPDGRLVSGGRDGHVRIWDGSGKQLRDWVPSGGEVVLGTIFNDDGKSVLTGAWNGEVKVHDAAADAPALVLAGNPPSIATRLTALETERQNRTHVVAQAVAALSEKEKRVVGAGADLAGQQSAVTDLTARYQTVQAEVQRHQSEVVRLESAQTILAAGLETTRQELTVVSAPTAPPAAVTTPALPDVGAVVEQAASAEASPAALSRADLGKKVALQAQSLADCEKSLGTSRTAAAQATVQAEALKAELAILTKHAPEKETALATLKQEAATAALAVATAHKEAAATGRALVRWQAAQHQKAALTLRAEARDLKEKWDSAMAEKAALEAAVTTAPAGPEAGRLAELNLFLTTLPGTAEAKQTAADAAWQEYLGMLPK